MNTKAQNALRNLMKRWDKIENASRGVSVASVSNLAHRVEELLKYTVNERDCTLQDFKDLMAAVGLGEEK